MKVLLTGSNGRLGKAIISRGRHEFVPFDLPMDVTDYAQVVRAAVGCEAIIHTAGLHGLNLETHSPMEFIRVNVGGTDNLFRAAVEHGIRRMVYSSTLTVFGHNWEAMGARFLTESTPANPTSVYGLTKRLGEEVGAFYHHMHGIAVAKLRYVAFDEQPPEQLGARLVSHCVWVGDAAQANLLALISPNVGDDVFHIGPATRLTESDLIEAVRDPWAALERRWPGSVDRLRAHNIGIATNFCYPVTDISKAQRLLGYEPEWTFDRFLATLT